MAVSMHSSFLHHCLLIVFSEFLQSLRSNKHHPFCCRIVSVSYLYPFQFIMDSAIVQAEQIECKFNIMIFGVYFVTPFTLDISPLAVFDCLALPPMQLG